MGVSEQKFYLWKRRFGGMGTAEVRRVCELENEVRRLKHLSGGADPSVAYQWSASATAINHVTLRQFPVRMGAYLAT